MTMPPMSSGADPNRPEQTDVGRFPGQPEYLGSTVLAAPEPAGRRMSRGWIAAVVAAALLLVAGSAGALALGRRLSGGGAHPAERLPAGALAYVELDLDPGAGQKVDAIRFLRKFPDIKDNVGDGDDLRRSFWELLAEDEEELKGIDYAKDIEPWLGQRLGIAVRDDGGTVDDKDVVVALQVTDEDKAREGIRMLNAKGDGDDAFAALNDGYAVLASSQGAADRAVADAKTKSLAQDERFRADLDALGELGVTSGWMDVEAAGRAAKSQLGDEVSPTMLEHYKGRVAWAARFTGDDLELVGQGHGLADTDFYAGDGAAQAIRDLPASTLAALDLANGEKMITSGWDALRESGPFNPLVGVLGGFSSTGGGGTDAFDGAVAEAERQTGLSLPEDLGVLLGRDFVVALDSRGLPREPRFGARGVTDPDRAATVLDKLVDAAGGAADAVTVDRTRDGYVVASDPAYAGELAKDGTLGDDAGFRAALPDLDDADTAVYVDVDKALAPGKDVMSARYEATFRAIDAIGITAASDGKGEASFRLKVVTR